MKHIISLGCSHTAGVGLDYNDCYVSVLERHYNLTINNLAIPGSNSAEAEKVLVKYLQTNQPDLVIAQWPNPFRRMHWYQEQQHNENINSCGATFKHLLKDSEKNFYRPWLQNIINATTMCRFAGVRIINILLENVDVRYHNELAQYQVKLHVDNKIPGETWLFDSAANDSMHHSAACHAQWANRLIGIIDEYPTR